MIEETTVNGALIVQHPRRGAAAMAAKRLAQALTTVLLLPRLLIYAVNRQLFGPERAFAVASEGIARVPGVRGVFMRQAFYRLTLAECGADVYFGWQTVFSKPSTRIGERTYFGRGCRVGWADIGAGSMLADGVQILSGAHQHGRAGRPDRVHQDEPQEYRRVTIGSGAWLGTNAIVMADVGACTVVGAGAVVTKALPADSTAVGIPARVVDRQRCAPDS